MLNIRTLIALLTIFLISAVCSAQVINSPKLDAQLVAIDSYSELVPVGTSCLIPFSADPSATGGDVFHVVSSTPDTNISLFLPNGTEITAANAVANGFEYATFQNDDNTGRIMPSLFASRGAHTAFVIPASSVAGSYSIKVVAPAGPEDTVVVASYLSSSEVRAGLIASAQFYRVGDTVLLSALVFNGESPVTNATVTAVVDDSLEDNIAPVSINLLDSGDRDFAAGDGVYTGTFIPTRAGDYTAAIRVAGTAPAGVNFKRLAGTTFRVQEPLATFDSFTDFGVDDNSDGLLDRILITSNLSVQRAGRYQFSLSLVASNGAVVKSESSADLLVGNSQLSVSFSAATILSLGVDGPYQIKDALLTFHSEPSVLVADSRSDVGATTAYALSSLDRPAFLFTGNNTAVGVDTNANGKFDILRIRAEVLALQAGSYEWSAALVDPAGVEIAFANSGRELAAGSNFIILDFDGNLIGQHGVSGPYTLRSVILFGENKSIIVDELFTTQAFSYKEFENSDNLRLGTVTANEASGDGDGFVEPGESGSFSVQIRNVGGSTITGISATLSATMPGVTIDASQSNYPSLMASGTAVNANPFTFTLSSAILCAQTITFKLTINHDGDGGIPSVVHLSFQPGLPTATSTFSYTGPAVAIPDNQPSGVDIPITVSGLSGSLKDLNFRFDGSVCSATAGATTVGLDHTFVGDLKITLTSPSGTKVRLMVSPGGGIDGPSAGNNFCNTLFDDEGGGPSIQDITAAENPYSGTFTPVESLTAFRGENPNGTWTLNVVDLFAADVGNVRGFSLIISEAECASSPAAILSDNFNDNSINTAIWVNGSFTGFTVLTVPIEETNQRLEIGPLLQNVAYSSSYQALMTANTHDFTDAYTYVELVQPPSAATDAIAVLNVGNPGDYYSLQVSAGMLSAISRTPRFDKKGRLIGTTTTTYFSIPYDPMAHRFLRIRHDATTNRVAFDTAPNTGGLPGIWVSRYDGTWHSSITLTSLNIEFKAGTYKAEANAPGNVIFDNFAFGLNSQ